MSKRELPAPIYAAAGAGDLAYQQLRKLPGAAARTLRTASGTAYELRRRVAASPGVDLARVRESAQRNAAAVVAGAATAKDTAVAGYRSLVAHGERVIADRTPPATIKAEPPAEIAVAPVSEAKPAASRNGAKTGKRVAAK